MPCKEKHTKYQPDDDEFRCPGCGAGVGDFCIDSDAESECEKLHVLDYLFCFKCQHEESGKAFAARFVKKASLVPCPTCKGKGFVKGNKECVTRLSTKADSK